MARHISFHLKAENVVFSKENMKIITQFILTLLFIGIGIWFLKHERTELSEVKNSILNAHWYWILAGIGGTFIYITLQGLMYVASFKAVHTKISLGTAIILFFCLQEVFLHWLFLPIR